MPGSLRTARFARLALAAVLVAVVGPAWPGNADESEEENLEFSVPSRSGPGLTVADAAPLWDFPDPALQVRLEAALGRLQLSSAIARQQLAVALVDITRIERPRVAAVHGERMFYAASLPKIAVMLAVFEKAESGGLVIDDETRMQLYKMIRVSSNADSTALMHKVGKEYIATVLRSPRYRLYDPLHNGGLWAGKDYAKSGLWRRDPLHNLSHGATVMQVARFYYLLERGLLVSPSASAEMKQILQREGSGAKFLQGIRQVQPDASVFRKGGTWGDYHADGALVKRSDGVNYIAVGLTSSPEGRRWLTEIIVAMDGLLDPETSGLAGARPER